MLGIVKIIDLISLPFKAASEIATGQDVLSTLKQMMSTAWRSLAIGPGIDSSAIESAQAAKKPGSYIDSRGNYQG